MAQRIAPLGTLPLPLLLLLKGFSTERARLGSFRGFGTERARLGTFRGLGTERARLGTFNQNLAKNWNFAWKNDKKGTKKTTQPRKNWSFAWKKLSIFTQKYHPASQKTEVLHKKMTKNWLKNWPKKGKTTYKNLKFCMKKWKSSYLWGFWKNIPNPNFNKLLNP